MVVEPSSNLPNEPEGEATPSTGRASRPTWLNIGRVLPRSAAVTWRASRKQAGPVPRLLPQPAAWPLVYFDDLLLTVMTMRTTAHSTVSDFDLAIKDAVETVRRLEAAGFLEHPESVHRAPGAPTEVRQTWRSRPGARFEHLSFRSGYEPPIEVPGQDRWFADEPNAFAHAYVLRRDDAPRPWLLALHPLGTGEPRDIQMMGTIGLQRDLGVNIIHPVSPRHGPRVRQKKGVRFPGPEPVMTFLGMSQAIWDLRRWVAWVRSQGATAVGVYGVSMGGFGTALLAGLEPGLACVVPAAPVVDLRTMVARHIGRVLGRDAELFTRLSEPAPMALNRLISPLTFEPKVARSGRFIFGAVGDRFAPPDQVVLLWHHWGKPELRWHQGSHLTGVMSADWRRFVSHALRKSGVVASLH